MGPAEAPGKAVTRRAGDDTAKSDGSFRVGEPFSLALLDTQLLQAAPAAQKNPYLTLLGWGTGLQQVVETQLGVPGHSWAASRLPIQQLRPRAGQRAEGGVQECNMPGRVRGAASESSPAAQRPRQMEPW